jgi:hypothetical protein
MPNGMRASALKLNGKPGDALMDRLEGLYSAANQAETQLIQSRLMKYVGESLDSKCFFTGSGSITDGITGQKADTRVAKLMLSSGDGVRFIDTLADKLDKDPDFYSTYDAIYSKSTTFPMKTREIFGELFKQMSDSFKQEEFSFSILVHFKGSTPVAAEMTFDLPDAAGGFRILLQKTTQGDTADYLFSMGMSTGGMEITATNFSLNIQATEKGYAFNGKLGNDMGLAGAMSIGLTGTTEIEKTSSDEYKAATKFNYSWEVPYSGSGDVDLELKEDIGFGARVGTVKQDAGYMYGELIAHAKEEATLEDFFASLSTFISSGIPGLE